MAQVVDMTGHKVGSLTVLSRADVSGLAHWVCRCVCGSTKIVSGSRLRQGKTISCGCIARQRLRERNFKHGNAVPGKESREYSSWVSMRSRCKNKKDPYYHRYGGRGIVVCDRWDSFAAFLSDMGPRPEGCTLDRIDPRGDYTPDNCAWATAKAQSRNKEGTRRLTILGETRPLLEWAERNGIPKSAVEKRLKYGWTPHDAVTRPRRKMSR